MNHQTLIISENCLIANGLIRFIQRDFPAVDVRVLESVEFISSTFSHLIIDYQNLTSPGKVSLEKLRNHYRSPRIMLLHRSSPDESLQVYLSSWLRYTDGEEEIAAQLKSFFNVEVHETEKSVGNSILSDREREVLRFVALGLTNKEISDELCISTHTVITHRKNITSKLGIKTIAGLAVYAVINGIITAEEMNG